jgi:hypothetical protein
MIVMALAGWAAATIGAIAALTRRRGDGARNQWSAV